MEDLEAPEGLHDYQYAAKICEDLVWPANKWNLELVGEAIAAIAKKYKASSCKAYKNLAARVEEAQKQGIEITGNWFRYGEYMNVKKQKAAPIYKLDRTIPPDQVPTEEDWANWRAAFQRILQGSKMQ